MCGRIRRTGSSDIDHHRRIAISRHASVLNSLAAASIAELSSPASTLPIQTALEAAR
jgi:hypothetical protein